MINHCKGEETSVVFNNGFHEFMRTWLNLNDDEKGKMREKVKDIKEVEVNAYCQCPTNTVLHINKGENLLDKVYQFFSENPSKREVSDFQRAIIDLHVNNEDLLKFIAMSPLDFNRRADFVAEKALFMGVTHFSYTGQDLKGSEWVVLIHQEYQTF